MQMTRIDDLSFGIDCDYIDLEQDAGCGEMSMIRLHRIHLAHLAELAGVITADRMAEQTIRTLQRRLRTLAREIHSLAEWVRSGPDDDEETFPDFLKVMALETLANALIDDLPSGDQDEANSPRLPDIGGDDFRADSNHSGDSLPVQPKPNITPHKPTNAYSHSEASRSLFEDEKSDIRPAPHSGGPMSHHKPPRPEAGTPFPHQEK